MSKYIDLALKYGGFTSLDKVYLEGILKQLTDEQKLAFVTPPPSVINAYFAELYQKKSPQEATHYFFQLSRELGLFEEDPDFTEKKPFIRLNLSGKSFGFAYKNEKEESLVFSEKEEKIDSSLLFEIAQIFPQYVVYLDGTVIRMKTLEQEVVTKTDSLTPLTDVDYLEKGVKLSGYNQEELEQLADDYLGQRYYRSENRLAMLYII